MPGDVQQALIYWECQQTDNTAGDDTITVNGTTVTGTLIGGQTRFFNNAYSSTHRADITALGLVSSGVNSLTVDDLGCTHANNGAGVLVIFDDGSDTANIELRDGNDLAFINLNPPLDTTVPQTFMFDPSDVERTATLTMFFSSVSGTASGGGFRPSAVEVVAGGTTTVFDNLLDSTDGEEWDTINLDVTIPAGTTMLTVQALSVDNLGIGGSPASFAWSAAGLSVPAVPSGGGTEGCTPGYWKNHTDSWVGFETTDDYGMVFGVDPSFNKDLLGAVRQGGGGEKALGRHAVAALLNSTNSGVDFAFSTSEVIGLVQDAYTTGNFESIKNTLEDENEKGCPLN